MKKINKTAALLAVILALFMCFAVGASAEGEVTEPEAPEIEQVVLTAPETVTSVVTDSSITLNWDAVENATGYRIFYKKANSWKLCADTADASYAFSNLKPGAKFTFAVRAYSDVDGVFTWAPAYTTHETAVQAIVIPAVTATPEASSVKLSWPASTGVTCYRIYYKSGNAWKVAVSTTSKTTHSFTKLKAGTKYTFAVRPYVKNGSAVIWSNYTQVETAVKAVAPSKITSQQNASAIKLSWTASAGATGYRIYYKSGNAWKVAVSTTSAISHTFSGLKAGAKFTFAVRPYVKNGSAVIWSDFTTYTAATVPATPKATATSSLGGQVVVSWNAVSGANGYQLYYKVNNGAYKLYKEYTSAQKLTFKNLTRGAKYTFVVRAFVNTSGGKVLSAYKEASTVVAYKIDRYNKVFETGNFIMQLNDPDLGVVTMGLKNGDVYVESTTDGLTMKLLYLKSKDKTYMILDEFKKYSEMPKELVGEMGTLGDEMKDSGSGVGTVTTKKLNGKTYDCEIFKNSQGETYRYYFSGDTLVYSESVAKDGTVTRTEFIKVVANPSDSYFKIPAGYSYWNLEFIYDQIN